MILIKPVLSKFKYFIIVSVAGLGVLVYTSAVLLPSSTDRRDTSVPRTNFHNTEFEQFHRDWINDSTAERQKVLCYILLSRKRISVAKLIRETWGSRCDKLIFFGGFRNSDPEVEVTFLNATEGYAYLWGKTKASIIHLDREYSRDYDWFVKADDDTFLILENLHRFVANLPSNQSLWFGYKLRDAHMKAGYLSGGAGYVFSKTGLRNIAAVLKRSGESIQNNTCDITGEKGYEDLELGKCCILAGIKEVISTDNEGRERFLPLSLSSLLNRDVSKFHWIWKQAWNPVGLGDKCCSPGLISMHHVTPSEMKTLYFLIYTLGAKG